MTEINFSQPVIDRADDLLDNEDYWGLTCPVLRAISCLDYLRAKVRNARDFLSRHPDLSDNRLPKLERSIAHAESILSQRGVTDDLTATEYMDAIEPKLKAFSAEWKAIEDNPDADYDALVEKYDLELA